MRGAFKLSPATIVGYALSFAGALLLYALNVPLAWLLGPLLVASALALCGFEIEPPAGLRRLGQLAIGTTAGLNMTSAVVLQLLAWLPGMILSSFAAIFVSATFSVLLARFAHLDLKTAFFANMPGGLAEMSNIAEQQGAHPEPIAIIQTFRVGMVVLIIPPTMLAIGFDLLTPPDQPAIAPLWIPVLLAAGVVGAMGFHLLRLNNPWTIGAVVGTGILAGTGIVAGRMPQPVFFAAQLLIGYAVGSRFRPSMIRRLPRVAFVGALTILGIAAGMILFSALLAGLTSLDLMTAILATSPGGMAEMTATAQTLHLAVALVAGFQVTRALIVNGFATYHWNFFWRSGYLSLIERLVGKPPAIPPKS